MAEMTILDELIRRMSVERLVARLDAERAENRHRTLMIRDVTLLRDLLPTELCDRLLGSGLPGMHALSFALRHRLSYVAVLAHLAACAGEGAVERLPHGTDVDLAVDFATVARYPWRGGAPVPIIGFAPSGAFVAPAHRDTCRAFDPYDIPRCAEPNAAGSPFCAAHAAEAWWAGLAAAGSSQSPSTLAKMCAFYFATANFAEHAEADLRTLVNDFLYKLREATFTAQESTEALLRFGLTSPQELVALGKVALRKRFLAQAHASHPDKGGPAEAFIELRRSYDILCVMLSETT